MEEDEIKVESLSDKTELHKKVSEQLEAQSTLHMTPSTMAEVFQEPRPQIIEAVEENEFEGFDHLREWCEDNIEDYHSRDVKRLFENGVIGHPTEYEGCPEGITTHKDQPLEVQHDMIICVPYDKDTGYINDGYDGFLVRNKERILEKLSALEHRQWQSWINYCIENYNLPDKLVQKWKSNDKPYEELPEEEKEKDRKYGRKVIKLLRGRMDI